MPIYLGVEFECLGVMDDLPHASDGGDHSQTHSHNDADLDKQIEQDEDSVDENNNKLTIIIIIVTIKNHQWRDERNLQC
jgi:hypothetical protein